MKKIIKLFMASLLIFTLYTPTGSHASEASNEEGFAYTEGEDPSIAVLDDGLVVSVQLEENQLTYSLGEYKGNTEYGYMHWNDSVPYGDIYNDEKPSSISIATLPNGDVIQVYELLDKIYYSLGRYEEGKINWYSSYKYFGAGEHPSLTVMDNGHLILVNEGLNTDALWYGYGTFENDEVTWHRNMITFDKGLEPSVSALDDGKIVVTHKEEVNGNLWSTIGTIDPDKKTVEFESAVRYESQSSNNPVSLQLDNGEILTMFDSNQSNGTWNRMGEVPEGGSSIEWTTNTYHQFDGKNNDVVQLQNGLFLNVHEDHDSDDINYVLGKYDGERVDWDWTNDVSADENYANGESPAITVLDNDLVVSVNDKDGKLSYQLGEYDNDKVYWTKPVEYGDGEKPTIATLENGDLLEVHEGENHELHYNLGRYEDGTIDWYSVDNYYGKGDHPNVTLLTNGDIVLVFEGQGVDNTSVYYEYGTFDNDEVSWHTNGIPYDNGLQPSIAALDNGRSLKTHKSESDGHLWLSTNKVVDPHLIWRIGETEKYEPHNSNNPVMLQLDNGDILSMFDSNQNNGTWNRMGEVSSNGQEVEWTTDTYHQFDGKNNDVVQLNNGRLLNVHEDHDSDEIRYVLGIYDEEEKRVFWGEPDREKPTTTSPIQYDTGVDPSVTILDNGDVLEVHKSEWSHTLFYNLGRFKDGKMYWYSTGNEYDKGRSPSVTTLANGDVLEVHRGEGSDTLWYTIGKYENGKIEWGGPSIKYDTGKAPSVTVLANGDVLEVHRSNWNNDLWYNIGKYKNGKIEWEGSIKYDRGRAPSVTVLANGDVLEVHQSDWNDDLWYNIGKYRDGKIEWEGSIKYDKGWNPSVAVLEDGKVLEVHSSEHADRLWYNIGKYRNGKIEWEGSINYDNGWNPSVAVRDGDIVEVHESGGIKRLWSTLMEYEDGDIYYLPPNTISPINWMEEMGNQSHLFGQLRLNEVLLPGTHDSGSSTITHRSKTSPDAPSNLYNILESPLGLIAREITADFGKTQHLSVEQQLDAGIRYFDLRVGPHTQEDEDKGTLKTMHQLYGEELETILNNVKSFIDQNPKEIIILDFQHFHEMTPDKYDYLVNEIKTIFSSSGRTDGDQLISQDELKNDTLENLWGKNKNVVVLFGKDNHEREINDSVDITKYQDGKTILNGNSNLYSPWPKTTDSEVLREKLSSNLEKAKEGGNKDKLFVSQGIYNPSVTQYILQGIRDYTLEDYAYRANPIVISWLGSSWLDSRTNIVMIDFFDNTDLVERIINSNYFIEEQN